MRFAGLLSAAILMSSTFLVGQAKTAAPPPPPPAATSTPAVVTAPTNGVTPASVTGSSAIPDSNTGTATGTVTGAAAVAPSATGSVMNPAATQPVQIPASTTNTAVGTGGVAYGSAAGGRLVTTPTVDLNNPNPSVGASNSTQGMQTGASNSTLSPTMPQVPVAYESANAGLGGISSAWSAGSGGESVAEASRQARVQRAKDHPRVFTNEDLARLSGAPLANNNGAVIANQNTMPASDVMQSQPQAKPAPIRSPFRPPAQAGQTPQTPQ